MNNEQIIKDGGSYIDQNYILETHNDNKYDGNGKEFSKEYGP